MSSGPPSISSLASFRHLHFCLVSLLCTEYSRGGADVHSATAHRVCINRSCLYAAGLCWRFKRVPSKTTEAVRLPLCSVLFCLSTVGYFRSLMPLKQCCKRLRLNWVCLCWALSLALSVCVPLCVLNGTTRSQAGPHAHNRTSEYMHTCTHTYARLSMQYTSGVHFTFVCGHS